MGSFVLHGNIIDSESPERLRVAADSYLVCEEGRCTGVFSALPERFSGLPLTDFGDRLILPGMTDLHLHAPQFAFRGLGMDLELLDWLNRPEVLSDYASWDEEQALKNLGFSEEEIERMRREGVDPEVFMLVKNQMYGELLGDVEAVDDAAEEAAAACLKGRTLADEIAALAALTVEDANALLQTALREENRAYVQIDPAEK